MPTKALQVTDCRFGGINRVIVSIPSDGKSSELKLKDLVEDLDLFFKQKSSDLSISKTPSVSVKAGVSTYDFTISGDEVIKSKLSIVPSAVLNDSKLTYDVFFDMRDYDFQEMKFGYLRHIENLRK
ncbi:MAG: hypothetical protein AABW88_01065 [Nanoarchaeota archaeon]